MRRGAEEKADKCGAAAFYNEHLRTAAPVVIEGIGARDEWVAARSFCDLGWLREQFGDACVPVEVGGGGQRTARAGRVGGCVCASL